MYRYTIYSFILYINSKKNKIYIIYCKCASVEKFSGGINYSFFSKINCLLSLGQIQVFIPPDFPSVDVYNSVISFRYF